MTEVPAWHARHQWDRERTSFSIRSTPGWRASTGLGKEVNNYMLISEWLDYVRLNWRKEEGQTMAEYGVVLAVITVAALLAFQTLGGGISKAIDKVTAMLP